MDDRTEVLIERAVGVLATFMLFQGASRLVTGISSPGTAAAALAVGSTAICQSDSVAICRVGGIANAPGRLVGKGLVKLGSKAIGAIQNRRALVQQR